MPGHMTDGSCDHSVTMATGQTVGSVRPGEGWLGPFGLVVWLTELLQPSVLVHYFHWLRLGLFKMAEVILPTGLFLLLI